MGKDWRHHAEAEETQGPAEEVIPALATRTSEIVENSLDLLIKALSIVTNQFCIFVKDLL